MVPAAELTTFTWHSLRVFMPHWSFVQGIDKAKRQYLGRWTNESTADVYVRSHRTMICDIWNQVTQSQFQPALGPVSTDTGEPIKEEEVVEVDPEDEEYTTLGASGPSTVAQHSTDFTMVGASGPSTVAQLSTEFTIVGASGPVSPEPSVVRSLNFDTPSSAYSLVQPSPATSGPRLATGKTMADMVPPPRGPLTAAFSIRRTGTPATHKVHFFTTSQTAVGCGWAPRADQIQIMESYEDTDVFTQCHRCFLKFTYPSTWNTAPGKPWKSAQREVSDMSSLSDTAFSDDTDSEADLTVAQL